MAIANKSDRILKQGAYPDPEDPAQPRPDPETWPPEQRTAFDSAAMREYRASLQFEEKPVRASILDDLSTYFQVAPEECVRRCVNWEQWSVEEWKSAPRETAGDIAEFYRTQQSWCYELIWHPYLQAEGHAYPPAVVIAQTLSAAKPGMRHLDFGSGTGATSGFFHRLGYETDLADISTSLLKFAQYRLDRRGQTARYIDLNDAQLEPERYDVITAIYTLGHVPDVAETARQLHRSLKAGGLLFADFDVRPETPENAWHLYDDDLPLRWHVHRAGFEQEANLGGGIFRYRKVERGGIAHAIRGGRDFVLFKTPLRNVARSARRAVARVTGR